MHKPGECSFWYCDRPKSVFVNNPGNPKPIRTKFYRDGGLGMGRFHGNFGHPRSNAAKITQKKRFARKTPNFIYRLSSGPICANCVLTADPILLTGFCIYCDHWDDSFLQFPSCVRVVNTSANGIKHALYSGTHKVTRRTKNFSAKWSIRVI